MGKTFILEMVAYYDYEGISVFTIGVSKEEKKLLKLKENLISEIKFFEKDFEGFNEKTQKVFMDKYPDSLEGQRVKVEYREKRNEIFKEELDKIYVKYNLIKEYLKGIVPPGECIVKDHITWEIKEVKEI